MSRVLLLGFMLLPALGCGREPPPADAATRPDSSAAAPAFPTLPDSLVLTAPGGVTVWFSGARVGIDSLGGNCLERGLVILRGEVRTLVPLLMTGAAPRLVNDTTIRARIWLHCHPGNTYDVDLRTGTPNRIQ